jgi:hypothetical protein
MTLAQLCHPSYGLLPDRDQVKSLIRMILKLDPVRSSILAGLVCSSRPFAEFPEIEFPGLIERIGDCNIKKYEYIWSWIFDYKKRENPLQVNQFFQKAFLEIIISREVTAEDIMKTNHFIGSARRFVDVVSRFNHLNANKGFIDMMGGEGIVLESISEIEESLKDETVILSTPAKYLASTLNNKVTILTSISSKNWTPRSIKEMTNMHVLTKTWNINEIYTEELEEKNQKQMLAVMMRAIMKRCSDKLITFQSNLSANGYENDGMLSEYFDE